MTRAWTLVTSFILLGSACSESEPEPDTMAGSTSTGGESNATPETDNETAAAETSDSDASSGSTGALDSCSACIAEQCFDDVAACLDDEACGCWLECLESTDDASTCASACGDAPATLEAVLTCTTRTCAQDCEAEGSTG